MLCCPLPGTRFFLTTSTRNHFSPFTVNVKRVQFKIRRPIILKQLVVSTSCSFSPSLSSVHYDSLRVLEWDKLCDIVASFATTSLGREATKAQLWSVNQSYEQSLRLMGETNAALEMHKQGACRLDFAHIDTVLVKSAIQKARQSIPVNGHEAIAVLALLECAETLQINLKGAIKEDADWYTRFMPLSEMITGFTINNSLVRLIQQVIDENGSVKDSASSTLKHSREQVMVLERKMHQLMERLIRSHGTESSILEVNNIGGRWCLKVGSSQTSFDGLLLSSGPGGGSIVEPLSAVPLNDELQRARALVAKAEAEVLSKLTDKIQIDIDDIEELLNNLVQLDVMNARATYSESFRGTCPDVIFPEGDDSSTSDGHLLGKNKPNAVLPGKREWILYLPQAYHPLLLQRHRENLKKITKDVRDDTTGLLENGTGTNLQGEIDADYTSGRQEVSKLDLAPPVPVDFSIARKTRVLVITGPNTGGKTICLKTIGLAAMMAKSGLHVLASEPVRIPWFDSVFADIGDEQSLSQSLSTFSGHLRQISSIQSQSTSESLVLLDEVGAGTNPLEGAALGMSLLEYFAEKGAFLTIATTHHGELKTLKYSNSAFENASMEFDEVNLRPTYKVLWGIPGRSNAINIAERLGLPSALVNNARKLYGSASAEINEVIIDMEKLKNDYQELLDEAHQHLMKSKDLYKNLLRSRRRILEHSNNLKFRKMQYVSEYAAKARSTIHKKVRQFHASTRQRSQSNPTSQGHQTSVSNSQQTKVTTMSPPTTFKRASTSGISKQSPSEKSKLPKVGDMVLVSSLGKEMKVISVDPAKEEILVRAGIMTFKLKFSDI